MRTVSVLILGGTLLVVTPGGRADDRPGESPQKAPPGGVLLSDLVHLSSAAMMQEAPKPAAPGAPEGPAKTMPEVNWPVGGIYTTPDTKDLGSMTGIPWLSGTKVRGWVDTHYVYNFNEPRRTVVNANQASSVVKGRDVSIEGRTFDVHHNSFSLSLAEVEVEKVPEMGGVGFKLDIAFGETQDIIVDTIRGSVGPGAATDSVTDFDKTFQHASVSYLAPVGNGLRLDAGKFVTHIGGETIETVKNWNYSHAFFYTYAIPFQDTGLRAHYEWTPQFYTELYFLNGWNVTIDNNKGKSVGPSIGWTPVPWLQLYANYLVGNEQTDNDSNTRHLVDSQLVLGPFPDLPILQKCTFMANFDLGYEEDAPTPSGVQGADWRGFALYGRYKVCPCFEPSLRYEYYRDADGFTTLVDQELQSVTLTLNTLIGVGKSKGSMLLLRPELRYDWSSKDFFSERGDFRSERDQFTLGMGVAYVF